jgi:hypothetical protein
MKVGSKHTTKESMLLELKKNFEEFVKKGAFKDGLTINRILFDINPAIEIIKDIDDDNLYKIEFYLDFYISEEAKANFKTTFNFRENKLTRHSEVTHFKHNFDYSLISRPVVLIVDIFTHIPVFSKNFFKNKGEIYNSPRYPELSEHENYSSFSLLIINVLIEYTYNKPKTP